MALDRQNLVPADMSVRAGHRARYLIRDRDAKYPALFDEILADAGIKVVCSGIRMPRMNSIMERWVRAAAVNCWTAP